MTAKVMEKLDEENRQKGCGAAFGVGDTVRVHIKIAEGDKERIQVFEGTVLCRKGRGSQKTFTVRRVSHGVGVEKIFPMFSPHISKVEVQKAARVRRAKLYYLRDRSGKQAKLREQAPADA